MPYALWCLEANDIRLPLEVVHASNDQLPSEEVTVATVIYDESRSSLSESSLPAGRPDSIYAEASDPDLQPTPPTANGEQLKYDDAADGGISDVIRDDEPQNNRDNSPAVSLPPFYVELESSSREPPSSPCVYEELAKHEYVNAQ